YFLCCMCSVSSAACNQNLHSFPTRRSSDLKGGEADRPGDRPYPKNCPWPVFLGTGWRRPLFCAGIAEKRPSPSSSEEYRPRAILDRKSTRLNSSHEWISYAVFCLKKKKK